MSSAQALAANLNAMRLSPFNIIKPKPTVNSEATSSKGHHKEVARHRYLGETARREGGLGVTEKYFYFWFPR